jgi:hypothetical protein
MTMRTNGQAPGAAPRRRRRPPSERDPLAAAWRVVDALWRDECEPPRAQAIIAALRVVFAAGQAPLDRDRALREAEVLGLAMHGLPPRDEAEQELARELFGRDYWGGVGAGAPTGDVGPFGPTGDGSSLRASPGDVAAHAATRDVAANAATQPNRDREGAARSPTTDCSPPAPGARPPSSSPAPRW